MTKEDQAVRAAIDRVYDHFGGDLNKFFEYVRSQKSPAPSTPVTTVTQPIKDAAVAGKNWLERAERDLRGDK